GQRPGRRRVGAREDVLPARLGARGRQRPRAHDRANLRRAARRHDRVGKPPGPHRLHDPPAARPAARPRLIHARKARMPSYDYEPPRSGEAIRAVWIVDDDRSIRWVLEKALAREGIAYKTFSSAYEVLQAFAVSQPQVLVSDIRMPGESGLVLLNKAREGYPHIPVIIMTAYSDLDSAVAAFQGGAFEYLPKPFDVDHALALIRRASTETPVTSASDAGSAEAPDMLGQAPAMQ